MKHILRIAYMVLTLLMLGNMAKAQDVIIGPTSGSSSFRYGPYYRSSATSSFKYSRYAYLYTAAELGLVPGSTITGVSWYKTAGTISGNNKLDVYLGNTSATTLPSSQSFASLQSATTLVYNQPTALTVSSGWQGVTFTTPFTYTGGSIIILVDHEKIGTASGVNNFVVTSAVGKAKGIASSSLTNVATLGSSSYSNLRPTIKIAIAPPCSGTPDAGVTSASVSNVCDEAVTLSLSGGTFNPDLTYQWQSSAIATSGWANIAGETSRTLTTTQSGNRYYRCVLTCPGSGLSSNSAPVLVSSSPIAGDANATAEIVCDATTTFDLSLANNITSTGLTYQWQSSSTETGTYTDITGANTATYTATQSATKYYRCKVSCSSALTTEYSSPVRVLYGGTIPAGSYTVGTGGAYASLDDVRLALQCGVAGAVTFNILPGTYTESIALGQISGTSATAKITFQKAPNTSGSVVITHPTATTIIRLNGTDNIVFNGLTILGQQTLIGYGFDCENVTITNNVFTGGLTGSGTNSASYSALARLSGEALGDWIISNNTVSGVAWGFRVYGASTEGPDSVYFSGNTVETYYKGLESTYASKVYALNNTITCSGSLSPEYAMDFENSYLKIIAKDNVISGNFSRGIYADNVNNTTLLLSNEIVQVSGNHISINASTPYGIFVNLSGGSATVPSNGTTIIDSNIIETSASADNHGIYLLTSTSAQGGFFSCVGNSVQLSGTSTASFDWAYGITFRSSSSHPAAPTPRFKAAGQIANNKIVLPNNSTDCYGIDIQYWKGESTAPYKIVNNQVSINGTGVSIDHAVFGIRSLRSDFVESTHNTIWVKGGGSSQTSGLYHSVSTSTSPTFVKGEGASFKNNIIIKEGLGSYVYLTSISLTPSFEANNYFGLSTPSFKVGSTVHASLSAWQGVSSQDLNSVIGDPVINSFTDMRVQGLAPSNAGIISGVVSDYYGNQRSSTTPDIGSHEFDYSPCFLAVSANVTERNINSLVLSWSSKNSAKIGTQFRFRKIGQTAWSYQSVSGTVTSSILNGLQANSTYEIGIREICSAQDTGLWGSDFVYGTTLCAYASAMPVTVNFNSSLSACINNGDAYGSGAWDIVTTDQFGPVASPDGSQFARVDQSDATGNNPYYFELRPVAMPSDRKQFNLDYYVGSNWTASPTVGAPSGFSASGGATPFHTFYMDQRAAYLLLASELTAAGYLPGNISGLTLTVGTPNVPAENFSISVGTTALTSLSSTVTLPTLTSVYSNASYQPISGMNTFAFSNVIPWNGTDNLLIVTCFDRSSYVQSSSVAVSTTPFTSVLYKAADLGNGDVCSDAMVSTGTSRPVFGLVGLPAAFTSPIQLEASIDDGDNWTSIFSVSQAQAVANADAWGTAEVDLNAYKDESVRLRVKGLTSGAGGTASGVAIDNLSITDFNACKRPVNLALSTTAYLNPLNTSVEVAWNAGISNETQWELTYGAAGHTPGTGTTVTVSTTPFKKLTGLTQGTTYDIYVRATCGANTYSAWVGPLRITTACVVPAAGSLENFDGTNWSSTSVSNCWSLDPQSTSTTTYGWKVGTGSTPTSSTGPNAASSPTKYLFVEADGGATGAEATLRAPFISTLGINYPEVAFDYHMYGSGMGKLFVDVSLDSGETWMTKDSIVGQQQGSTTAAWQTSATGLYGFGEKSLLLVRLRYQRGASTTGDVSIDNFEVRDGCSLDLSGTLTANPSCNGETDGAIVAQVENANGPVLYRLGTSGAFDTIVEFNDLAAGAYTLFARDSFNCETSLVITLTEPAVISTTATIANATCFGAATGTIELIPTGGTAPYSYEWSNAADTTFMETTRNVDSLLAGTYVVDITDARGCTHSATYVVGQAPEIVATTVSRSTVSCVAQDGSIVLGVSGGTGAKSIVWNTTPVQTGLTASGLAVGSYTATITDANGCVVTYTEQVLPADTVGSAVTGTTDVSCWGQADGTATLGGVGGQAPYTFFWGTNPPQTTQTAVNLLPGTYTGIVTDAKGCTSTKTVTIGYADTTAPALVTKPATLSLDAAGAAMLTASDVVLTAADGCGIISTTLSKVNFACSDLGANTVQVTVTDGLGNSTTLPAVVTIVDNIAPMFNTIGSPLTLTLSSTGTATLTAAQAVNMVSDNCGVPTMSFSKTAFNCSDRGMNTVTATATDASGNTTTATIQVNVVDNAAPVITLNSAPITVTLNATGNGTITLSQVGSATDNCGTPTVTLSTTSFTCANVGANQVVLTATDASGNVSTATKLVTVVDNSSPVLTVTPSNVVVGSCNAIVNYAYTATDNCGYTMTRTSGLASGSTFPVGVTTVTHAFADASGNTVNHSFTVTVVDGAPTLPTLGAYCPSDAVVNLTSGQAGLVFAGPGVVNGTQFDPSQASVGQNSLSYSFTDANGCLHTGSVLATVNAAPAKPTVALVSPTLLDAQGVQASAYQWYYSGNAIVGGTSKTQAVVGYGIYEVEASNSEGCSTRSNGLDYSATGLGMYDLIQGLIRVSPVPAIDFVTLSNGTGLEIKVVKLYSINGQVIKDIQPKALDNQVVISVADLPAGLYFLSIELTGDQIINKRIEKL